MPGFVSSSDCFHCEKRLETLAKGESAVPNTEEDDELDDMSGDGRGISQYHVLPFQKRISIKIIY